MNFNETSYNRLTSNVGLLFTICASTIVPSGNPIPAGDYKSIRPPFETVYPHFNAVNKKNSEDEPNAVELINNCATTLLSNSVDLDADIVDMVNENFWDLV